jgi:hypothetical protein
VKAYDPSEPRDEAGRWTSTGGNALEGSSVTVMPHSAELTNPMRYKVTAVGAWADVDVTQDPGRKLLYVNMIHSEKPSHDTVRVMHGIRALARRDGAVLILGQVVNRQLAATRGEAGPPRPLLTWATSPPPLTREGEQTAGLAGLALSAGMLAQRYRMVFTPLSGLEAGAGPASPSAAGGRGRAPEPSECGRLCHGDGGHEGDPSLWI